jgi:hypothetical protein
MHTLASESSFEHLLGLLLTLPFRFIIPFYPLSPVLVHTIFMIILSLSVAELQNSPQLHCSEMSV